MTRKYVWMHSSDERELCDAVNERNRLASELELVNSRKAAVTDAATKATKEHLAARARLELIRSRIYKSHCQMDAASELASALIDANGAKLIDETAIEEREQVYRASVDLEAQFTEKCELIELVSNAIAGTEGAAAKWREYRDARVQKPTKPLDPSDGIGASW